MKKIAFAETTATVALNGYRIRAYTFQVPDPDNLNDGGRLIIQYDLGRLDADGKFIRSPLPGHSGCTFNVYNVGDAQQLTRFLEQAGPGKDDLLAFSYHDLEPLVEEDIMLRFGIETEAGIRAAARKAEEKAAAEKAKAETAGKAKGGDAQPVN